MTAHPDSYSEPPEALIAVARAARRFVSANDAPEYEATLAALRSALDGYSEPPEPRHDTPRPATDDERCPTCHGANTYYRPEFCIDPWHVNVPVLPSATTLDPGEAE